MTRRVENAVILTGADAALLYTSAHLRELRIAARGKSDRLYTLLTDITSAAFAHHASLDGTKPQDVTEKHETESAGIVTVRQVAREAGITPRAVRNHIGLGLLEATQQGRIWIITAHAAEQYIAGRKAA
ncbi:hypothetical protein [Microbacterium murale]|uniref:Helix-turn-helix domain-containing protein n=1 Tax=Microbacterium murale TaxID=1081040 RepID=A0ABQ1RUS7_9MICO|nr:hypothetical protein [Microbacterium murale]GGD83185.1 hypothetical protein GCM10007269_27540 [Microbacterium murale]